MYGTTKHAIFWKNFLQKIPNIYVYRFIQFCCCLIFLSFRVCPRICGSLTLCMKLFASLANRQIEKRILHETSRPGQLKKIIDPIRVCFFKIELFYVDMVKNLCHTTNSVKKKGVGRGVMFLIFICIEVPQIKIFL